MSVVEKIIQISKQPPEIIWRKGINLLNEKWRNFYWKPKFEGNDYRNESTGQLKFHPRVNIQELDVSGLKENVCRHLINKYLDHRYDLLGSGWIQSHYDSIAIGCEDFQYNQNLIIQEFDEEGKWLNKVVAKSHLATSKQYWKLLRAADKTYTPIDWQKDHKSGFRWDAKQWYKAQRQLHPAFQGIDLKMPWELSRLQHLVQLALFAIKIPEIKKQVLLEFRSQTLDFFMTNPYGMGVNHAVAMDVGFRCANLLLAFDILKQLDNSTAPILDAEFQEVFFKNIFLQARFVLFDNEYHSGLSSNHYLGNVCGLAFTGAYLSGHKELDHWLYYGTQQLHRETLYQFFEDGGNFEGSTSYHRMSAEMVLYTAALLAGLPKERRAILKSKPKSWDGEPKPIEPSEKWSTENDLLFEDRFWSKLADLIEFTAEIRIPDGNIPQYSDNDSGGFLRLTPNGYFLKGHEAIAKYAHLKNHDYLKTDDEFWFENHMNHDPILAAANGMLNRDSHDPELDGFALEQSLASALFSSKQKIQHERPQTTGYKTIKPPQKVQSKTTTINFSNNIDLKKLTAFSFDDFGIHGIKSDEFHLSISAITNMGMHHNWGHIHNDKLGLHIYANGKTLARDPGTYLYTPINTRRNQFRQTSAHNGPAVNGTEQNRFVERGLFTLMRDSSCKVEFESTTKLMGTLKYQDVEQQRLIEIFEDRVEITDYSNKPFTTNFDMSGEWSDGYGQLINAGYGG